MAAAPLSTTRVDRWVWAVRLVPTRAQGAAAARAGHIRINGQRVKPAAAVKVGDEVRLYFAGRERIVDVVQIIEKRVGAAIAVECLIDRSPPPAKIKTDIGEVVAPPVAFRERGSGRPTKRERRKLDDLRGRDSR